jgi:hypothetical protein
LIATALKAIYGATLTIDYKKAIQAFFLDKLKDPLSAQYLFESNPEPWWTIDYVGRTLHTGYAVRFQLNSKNSYGGYIGFRKWLVLFRDNQIIAFEPNEIMFGTLTVTLESVNDRKGPGLLINTSSAISSSVAHEVQFTVRTASVERTT